MPPESVTASPEQLYQAYLQTLGKNPRQGSPVPSGRGPPIARQREFEAALKAGEGNIRVPIVTYFEPFILVC